jgi:hypothetical protein
MQTQFEAFDAEGVFDQPIKPLRIRKRKQRRQKFEKWLVMTEPRECKLRGPKPPASQLRGVLAEMKKFDLAHSEVPLSPAYWHQVYMAEQRGEPISVPGVSGQRLKWRRPEKKNEVAETAAEILARHDIDKLLEALDRMEAGDELTVMLEGEEVCTITRTAPDRLPE